MADDDGEGEEELLLPLHTLEDVQQRLAKFLEKNPAASISTMDIPKVGKIHKIERPWGDPTMELLLPNDPAGTIEILNELYLPERLSALWHVDSNDIEVIWTGPTGATINAIEGFWAILKRGINGTHIHVSGKHLPKYLGEFEYRWNMRAVPHLMLDRLLYSFVR